MSLSLLPTLTLEAVWYALRKGGWPRNCCLVQVDVPLTSVLLFRRETLATAEGMDDNPVLVVPDARRPPSDNIQPLLKLTLRGLSSGLSRSGNTFSAEVGFRSWLLLLSCFSVALFSPSPPAVASAVSLEEEVIDVAASAFAAFAAAAFAAAAFAAAVGVPPQLKLPEFLLLFCKPPRVTHLLPANPVIVCPSTVGLGPIPLAPLPLILILKYFISLTKSPAAVIARAAPPPKTTTVFASGRTVAWEPEPPLPIAKGQRVMGWEEKQRLLECGPVEGWGDEVVFPTLPEKEAAAPIGNKHAESGVGYGEESVGRRRRKWRKKRGEVGRVRT